MSKDIQAEVRRRMEGWVNAFNARDMKALMGFYADDVFHVYPGEGQVGRGKVAQEHGLTATFQMGNPVLALTSLEVVPVSADAAVGIGTWTNTLSLPGGQKMVANVRSTDTFIRVGGEWVMSVIHASVGLPPPPAPPK